MIRRASQRRVGVPRRSFMSTHRLIARNLAAAFLAGTWSQEHLLDRVIRAWGRKERWQRGMIRRVGAAFSAWTTDLDWEFLASFIEADSGFRKVVGRLDQEFP